MSATCVIHYTHEHPNSRGREGAAGKGQTMYAETIDARRLIRVVNDDGNVIGHVLNVKTADGFLTGDWAYKPLDRGVYAPWYVQEVLPDIAALTGVRVA